MNAYYTVVVEVKHRKYRLDIVHGFLWIVKSCPTTIFALIDEKSHRLIGNMLISEKVYRAGFGNKYYAQLKPTYVDCKHVGS